MEQIPFSERHLQCVWFDGHLRPKQLRSSENEEVTVIDPGRWNLEAGPDFLDAVLVIDSGKKHLKGDVEVHIHAPDWTHHGHHRNPAYDHVIAHVTYFADPDTNPDLPTEAVRIPLQPLLESDPTFFFESIDPTAYPYATQPDTQPPCARALARLKPDPWIAVLESAGKERVSVKSRRIRKAVKVRGREQALYEALMTALGYKHNRNTFRILASDLPLAALRKRSGGNAQRAYALLLSSSRSTDWHLAGLRPQNHPVRRLASAAVLWSAHPDLATELLSLDLSNPKTWYRRIHDLFRSPNMNPAIRIGPGRIAAIISNVIIPFLASENLPITAVLPLMPAEQDNALIRQMAYTLFGRDHNPALYRNGLCQQGLLQIFHDFCLTRRGGCEPCALATALGES